MSMTTQYWKMILQVAVSKAEEVIGSDDPSTKRCRSGKVRAVWKSGRIQSLWSTWENNMASHGSIKVVTSPKGTANGDTKSPKGHCLCSPTTHQGSFRCRFHRSATMKRSKSMPSNTAVTSLSPKSVDST
ncbi:hypothetical protein AAG906_009709 [Vitis piasezkii]